MALLHYFPVSFDACYMKPSVSSVPSLCTLTAETAGNVAFLCKTCQWEQKHRVGGREIHVSIIACFCPKTRL